MNRSIGQVLAGAQAIMLVWYRVESSGMIFCRQNAFLPDLTVLLKRNSCPFLLADWAGGESLTGYLLMMQNVSFLGLVICLI